MELFYETETNSRAETIYNQQQLKWKKNQSTLNNTIRLG